jgi:uncharacterized protein
LLTAKLGSALANKTTLSVVLTASIIAGALAVQMASMSLDLADNAKTIDLKNQEIEQHLAAIATQKQEIEDKAGELEGLRAEITAKSQEAESLGSELAFRGEELAALQAQAGRLQAEISMLQSKIRSDEQYVASLSRQLELTEQGAKRVRISHYSLAVINDERGVVFPIEVEIINSGTGTISIDVSNAQYQTSFQTAVRTAATVASEYTGQSIEDKDIIVRITGDQTDGELATIDGSSAGALIAGMMVAGLTDGQVNDKVMVTGTINPNGSVGRVGGLEEKVEAASEYGAHVLLVPKSQDIDSTKMAVVGVLDIEEVAKHLILPK